MINMFGIKYIKYFITEMKELRLIKLTVKKKYEIPIT